MYQTFMNRVFCAALLLAGVSLPGCLEMDMTGPEEPEEQPGELDDVKSPPADDEGASVDKSTMPTNGTPVSGTINFSGDFNWHSFYIGSSQSCAIETILNGSLVDSVIELHGPNSTSAYITEDDDSGPGWASLIVRRLNSAGSYYVKVRGYGSHTGTYQVRARCAPCTTPNGSCYEANGTISPSTGQCTYPPKPAGTSCNDSESCTSNDQCNGAGYCSGTSEPYDPSYCDPTWYCEVFSQYVSCSGGYYSYAWRTPDCRWCIERDACGPFEPLCPH